MTNFYKHGFIIQEASENNSLEGKKHLQIYGLCNDSLDYGKVSLKTEMF